MNFNEALVKQKAMLEKLKSMNEEEEVIEQIKIIKRRNVFYPHKDTIFLAKSVFDYAGKNILEVGTGSGFIAIYLSKNAKKS